MLKVVLSSLKILKEEGVWLEIVNLVIPTNNDDMKMIEMMCKWIKENLGPDVPLSFSRFYPMHHLNNLPPTPVETLHRAREVGLRCGLHYVYVGNVPGDDAEDTYCPVCRKKIVDRTGYAIIQNNIRDNKCKFCGEKIAGVWGK